MPSIDLGLPTYVTDLWWNYGFTEAKRLYARDMSNAMKAELSTAPIGHELQRGLENQVHLITSLTDEAADRVHEIAVGNLYGGARYGEMIEQIMNTGEVVRSRATTIARTETARVSSTLTKIRAQHIGSPGYIWRTVHDQRVRDTHRKMDGVFVYWDKPVVVDVGVPPYHAGCIWNCRCFADPVIPDQYRV